MWKISLFILLLIRGSKVQVLDEEPQFKALTKNVGAFFIEKIICFWGQNMVLCKPICKPVHNT